MVSKTVIVAFVALCCVQAFAAPHNEEEITSLGAHQLGGYIKCVKDLAKTLTIFKDVKGTFSEYKTIFSSYKAAKATCATKMDGKTVTEEYLQCKKVAQTEMYTALWEEIPKLGAKFQADLPVVENIIAECF